MTDVQPPIQQPDAGPAKKTADDHSGKKPFRRNFRRKKSAAEQETKVILRFVWKYTLFVSVTYFICRVTTMSPLPLPKKAPVVQQKIGLVFFSSLHIWDDNFRLAKMLRKTKLLTILLALRKAHRHPISRAKTPQSRKSLPVMRRSRVVTARKRRP